MARVDRAGPGSSFSRTGGRVGRTGTAGRFAAVAVLALTLSSGILPPANAAVVCVDDTCDGNQWQAARGADDSTSYWGMGAGHNCTNYVAWKLSTNGIVRPKTGPGDSSEWAVNARADGYAVDSTPLAGSVAQWDAFADSTGAYGHVAYVERVNDDGTILISEDFWRDSDRGGPLTFRTIDPATVSHFIHYADSATSLRETSEATSVWSTASARLNAKPTSLSVVSLDDSSVRAFYTENGAIYYAMKDVAGWTTSATGLSSRATSISAANMGGAAPQLMTVDDGRLFLTASTGSGWQKMSVGLDVTGEISAVNAGGMWPTVMLSQGGTLYELWGDMSGWHGKSTGLKVWNAISTVAVAGHIEVYSIENGFLFRSWEGPNGWQRESTGVAAGGVFSAAAVGDSVKIMISQDGLLSSVQQDATGWQRVPTGLTGGALVSSATVASGVPVTLQAG